MDCALTLNLPLTMSFGQDNIVLARSPVTDLKAVKNDVEIDGFRQSHIRDGAALARYFAWLQEQLDSGVVLNESEGADQLEKYRSCVPMIIFIFLSTEMR